MSKVKQLLSQIFLRAWTVCVIVTFLFFLIAQIMKSADIGGVAAMTLLQYLLFFIFSLVLSAEALLFKLPLPKPICQLIHFGITAVAFFAVFILGGKFSFANTSSVFVAMMLYIILYAVGLGAYLLCRFILRRITKKEDEVKKEQVVYEKRF